MHLSAVMSWLYKTMENRKKVYSKIKFVEKYKNWILKKKPFKIQKNGKIAEKYDEKRTGR